MKKILLSMCLLCAFPTLSYANTKPTKASKNKVEAVQAVQVDPLGLCRSAVARIVSQWTQEEGLVLKTGVLSENKFLIRIDDTRRPETWRQPVSHAICDVSRVEDGQPRIDNMIFETISDPGIICSSVGGAPSITGMVDENGVVKNIISGNVICDLRTSFDGSYSVTNTRVAPSSSRR